MEANNSTKSVLIIVPNALSSSGSAVNERQLTRAISRYANVVEICSLASLLRLREIKKNLHYSKEIKIFYLPIVSSPRSFSAILTLLAGLVFTLLAILKRPRFIYVRSSSLALPVLWLKRLHKASVAVKIPAIVEDEIRGSRLFKSSSLDIKLYSWFMSLADRYVISYADRVVIPSVLLYKELCKRRKIKSNKMPVLVPAGIDLREVAKIKIEIQEKRRITLEEKRGFTVGFVGSLEWWQGVDTLVKAVHMLKQKTQQDLKLLVIGDGPMRTKIETLCKQLGVDCTITGFVPHEEALKLMATLEVLVVPRSRTPTTESIVPIKIIEAWALGVPVITTHHIVFDWLGLRDGEDIVYCEPTPYSVAEAIKKLVEDPKLRAKLSLNNEKLAKKFDYNLIALRLLETLSDTKIKHDCP